MRCSGNIAPASGAGPFTGHSRRSVRRMPARMAATKETLSCEVRWTGMRGTTTSCVGDGVGGGAGAGGLAVAAAATGGRLPVSGVAESVAVRTWIVSRAPADDCGVDAVDTAAPPLPTDSPHALATSNTSARTRLISKRDGRDMIDEI